MRRLLNFLWPIIGFHYPKYFPKTALLPLSKGCFFWGVSRGRAPGTPACWLFYLVIKQIFLKVAPDSFVYINFGGK
jgi:hypothetical protein